MSNLPSYHKRAFAHNYHAPFIYHIILKKKEGVESFGVVKGDARIAPGKPGCAYIAESSFGREIAGAILDLPEDFPILQVYQYKIMPDHVHLLLNVKSWSEHHLDVYIAHLTENITLRCGREIMQKGYCDKPVLRNRSLDTLFRYIRENPHRLAMRMQFPQFFRLVRKLKIGDQEYAAYGNLFLLRNPDKVAVKVSSKFSEEERMQNRRNWLYEASRGGVLVSPFISAAEKEIRREAEVMGGRFILITHEAFAERFKPSGNDFELCTEGRMLIVSLGKARQATLSRSLCMEMNGLANAIAAL